MDIFYATPLPHTDNAGGPREKIGHTAHTFCLARINITTSRRKSIIFRNRSSQHCQGFSMDMVFTQSAAVNALVSMPPIFWVRVRGKDSLSQASDFHKNSVDDEG
ncbi:hypothetical protein I7I53_03039 [Histoplasma capsulatum var. duboisii H88]|uniref:Uncharacterized protein n=1 Tax=Ajellomyces capsulatus (strain H88) TaxID=544711 RepID=A0A8A1LQ25_AJEC8|nr:hypothetical protein I7I53_03039 [Histoplasma capsulatum var. duboisii H88]